MVTTAPYTASGNCYCAAPRQVASLEPEIPDPPGRPRNGHIREMERGRSYIVVGAGALGSAAAYWLTRSGAADVLVLEQYGLGHGLGASEDHSRIIRHAYHSSVYTALTQAAYDAWAEIESETGLQLVVKTGGLDWPSPATPGEADLGNYRCSLAPFGIPSEDLTPPRYGAGGPPGGSAMMWWASTSKTAGSRHPPGERRPDRARPPRRGGVPAAHDGGDLAAARTVSPSPPTTARSTPTMSSLCGLWLLLLCSATWASTGG